MFCPNCGNELEKDARFCNVCGQPLNGGEKTPHKKKNSKKVLLMMTAVAGSLLAVFAVVLILIVSGGGRGSDSLEKYAKEEKKFAQSDISETAGEVFPLVRPSLIKVTEVLKEASVEPQVDSYKSKVKVKNLTNWEQLFFDPDAEALELLTENLFCVETGYDREFYETYETNRYALIPSFVTVDSMMHTYHLYFSYLMKKTEKTELADTLASVSEEMLAASIEQYGQLKGSEWEEAALRNVVFFSVGTLLQEGDVQIHQEAVEAVQKEQAMIMEASAVEQCSLTGTFIDYSQFRPRGYYEGDKELEQYFRAMMWYGQIGFIRQEEDLERSAVLMTLAMQGEALEQWERIYTVTSFFAGASDDWNYYEYLPAIEAAYGKETDLDALAGNEEGWMRFRAITETMKAPAINSIPVMDDQNPDTKSVEEVKGYRFMGQRFTIDAAIFQQLIYENVQENSDGEKRMLPDTLDVAAAMGSDAAYEILEKEGDTDYAGYKENMEALRAGIENAPDSLWSQSLYSNWLYTLQPLLEKKEEGYPDFMRNEQWEKKNLESFAGSYTELKHDTVLYAKQVMAEMGGGELPKWDDRGYVEPEVQVWFRFARLAEQTAEGLEALGMLHDEDEENLSRLAEMANQFLTMSEKELENKLLSEEEYELIRNYGGNLEHFWLETLKEEGDEIQRGDFPAAIVTDIATDPNGICLQVGTGNPSRLYVVVPVDGELHICVGAVYSFYQFEQPISQRLTDSEWRQKLGISISEDGRYSYDETIKQPKWTQSYRCEK